MKKAAQDFLFILVFLGVIVFLIPSYSAALSAIELGDESEVTFYGFFRNNAGMFLRNQPYAQSGNDLATLRTWFRGYTDYRITDKLRLWMAVQFVWEPRYHVEDDALTSAEPPQRAGETKGWKEYSEYRNINDILREVSLEWRPTKNHSIKIGRQIAIWGEALTTRVGDVIHPDDGRFTMVVADLEDTRIPSWMLRVIHDFPSITSSLEWVVIPNLVQNMYGVTRGGTVATMDFLSGQWTPGQRFGLHPEDDGNLGSFSNYAPTGAVPVREDYPGTWNDMRAGFRTNTTARGYNFGMIYFHTQEYNQLLQYGNITSPYDPGMGIGFVDQLHLTHPSKDIFGLYMNKQLPWPGVLRAEAIYVPNQPFHTMDPLDEDGLVREDYVKYMLAYDLNSFFYFQWHKSAPFDVTLEHIGEVIFDNDDIQYIIYETEQKTWNPSFNMRLSTTWLYGKYATDVVFSYIPWGNSGLFMPTVKYMPPWLNEQLTFELKYVNVYGSTDYKGLGMLRTKDMIVLTTQFNW